MTKNLQSHDGDELKRNAEGYHDPTAHRALSAILREERHRDLASRMGHARRPLVYICSPFGGDTVRNAKSARRFCRFAVLQGVIPFAPHLLYPQFMSDTDPAERELALSIGIVWLSRMDEVWVFGDRISEGMRQEIVKARAKGIPLRFFTADCEVRAT